MDDTKLEELLEKAKQRTATRDHIRERLMKLHRVCQAGLIKCPTFRMFSCSNKCPQCGHSLSENNLPYDVYHDSHGYLTLQYFRCQSCYYEYVSWMR